MKNTSMTEDSQKVQLGFWIYLMTDCLLFATLFATFAVLRDSTYGGSSLGELIKPAYVLAQTLLLLSSSYTCSMMVASAGRDRLRDAMKWLVATFSLGAAFLFMEILEFRQLVIDGDGWRSSAALSSFFTLVGTHGLHITIGLLWAGIMGWVLYKKGLSARSVKKLKLFSMYWHFLDIIWILVFTVVYLRSIT